MADTTDIIDTETDDGILETGVTAAAGGCDWFDAVMPLVQKHLWVEVRRELSPLPPPEVADFINRLEPMQRVLLIRYLPRHLAADAFSELTPVLQDEILNDLTNTEIRTLLTDLEPDDRAALIDEMPAPMMSKLLNLLSPQDLKQTRELLGYPEDSVGRMMTPNIVHIKEGWTVRKALEHIRDFGHDSETINMVYVTGSNGKLVDDITLSQLILASPDEKVSALMDYNFFAISAMDGQAEAVEMIKKYNYFALPVVDAAGVLLGIVTVDDLMDIADAHATEDFHKIGGVSIEPDEGPIQNIKDAPVLLLYRRRIVWLILLIIAGIFSGTAISFFEEMIMAKAALVFFLTLLMDCGGNSGSQSATLMVRALATGDVKAKDWGRMILKESLVSSALGGALALAVAPLGVIRDGPALAVVVALSMFMVTITGSMIGACLPFIMSKLKRDPAMASIPLVASLADITGVLIYFSIATVILM
ncbi:MAG: magnesium transporter [Chitinispirillales bacterium]|nr:magnesium transporter [Chitinispirillales bacterium]